MLSYSSVTFLLPKIWHRFSTLISMRMFWMALFLLLGLSVHTNEYATPSLKAENKLFIITLDGLRWQEVFNGADSALVSQPQYNTDTTSTKALYWSPLPEERRKKLMPFFWNVMARQGELYGNRRYQNNMNVANPYALSYPGYNELLTGHVDLTIYNNDKTPNTNLSVLEFLASTALYRGKVAAFTSWDAFPYILNKTQSNFYINSGYEQVQGLHLTPAEHLLNRLQEQIEDKKTTRYDELTFIACKEYIQKKKPSVVLLSLGGTDEAAHNKQYDQYLQQAANADRMIGELWQYLQRQPEYAGQTTFLITTDHGRGAFVDNWYTHGVFVNGASQTWMGLLGHNIQASGEQKAKRQLYLKNVKPLILQILSSP